jgi:hypothetical protein
MVTYAAMGEKIRFQCVVLSDMLSRGLFISSNPKNLFGNPTGI